VTRYCYSWKDPARLVSSVLVVAGPMHATITVWNRGANCGDLIVRQEDATLMVARLLGVTIDKLPEAEVLT